MKGERTGLKALFFLLLLLVGHALAESNGDEATKPSQPEVSTSSAETSAAAEELSADHAASYPADI